MSASEAIARLRELLPPQRPLLEIDTIGYIPSAGRCDINRGDERVAEFVKKEDAAAIVAAMNSLESLLACAEALQSIVRISEATDDLTELSAKDIIEALVNCEQTARLALQALAGGGA